MVIDTTVSLVVTGRPKRVKWESLPEGEELLIRCETPTLTGGVPTDWVNAYLTEPDSFGLIGERDTEGASLVQAAAMTVVPVSRQDEDDEFVGIEPEVELEDRLDTCEHAVVFTENTR